MIYICNYSQLPLSYTFSNDKLFVFLFKLTYIEIAGEILKVIFVAFLKQKCTTALTYTVMKRVSVECCARVKYLKTLLVGWVIWFIFILHAMQNNINNKLIKTNYCEHDIIRDATKFQRIFNCLISSCNKL